MRHEITRRIPLLNTRGLLTQEGFARKPLPAYRRGDVKTGKASLKEQDRYLIMSGQAALALSITGSGFMRYAGVSFLDAGEGVSRVFRGFSLSAGDKLPERSDAGDCHFTGPGFGLHFLNREGKRTLVAQVRDMGPRGSLYAKLELTEPPEESLVLAVPFESAGEFCYSQKMPGLKATGRVQYGDKDYAFCNGDSFGALQWTRGVYGCPKSWYTATAAGLWKGLPFAFSLGRGFTSSPAAVESMLFYDGRASVLEDVDFHPEPKTRVWTLRDPDGRLNLRFTPLSASPSSAGGCRGQLIYGKFDGAALLDDGQAIEVSSLPGLIESTRRP